MFSNPFSKQLPPKAAVRSPSAGPGWVTRIFGGVGDSVGNLAGGAVGGLVRPLVVPLVLLIILAIALTVLIGRAERAAAGVGG